MSGGYTISDGDRDFPGTSITLHLRDDQLDCLDWWRVSDLVKKYSDFIAYPIYFREIVKETPPPADEKAAKAAEEERKRREEREAEKQEKQRAKREARPGLK